MRKAEAVRTAQSHAMDAELAELGEECTRVLGLLQRLARAKSGGQRSEILGELSAAVLHLHVHTGGLDRAIDELLPDRNSG